MCTQLQLAMIKLTGTVDGYIFRGSNDLLKKQIMDISQWGCVVLENLIKKNGEPVRCTWVQTAAVECFGCT